MKKKQITIIGLVVFMVTSMITTVTMGKGSGGYDGFGISEEDVGKICVASVFPTITRGAERVEITGQPAEPSEETDSLADSPTVIDTQVAGAETPQTANVDYDKPLVILYHTHATESYQPVTEGNFHTLGEAGSIREVGEVMAAELESLGIEVIHDKTIHDSPSYSQSYTRSLETAKSLMQQYPSAIFVVDLHRDAASYTGNVGKTVLVGGETAAKYNLVVGRGNPNVNALEVFANAINAKAESMYPGFGGRIIDKAYKFNQHISDYCLLVEIGNNENNIKEAKVTAKYFAQVLAEAIKDINQE